MMNLVIAILTILGIPVSIGLQVFPSRIRNRNTWNNVKLFKSTWLLIGAFFVSAVCAMVSIVHAACYYIVELFTHIPQGRSTVLLIIECIIHFLLAIVAACIYMKEKDKGDIVFWPTQR